MNLLLGLVGPFLAEGEAGASSNNTIIQVVSGLLALVSVSGGIFTAIRSGKDRRERDSDRARIDAEREKLGAEEDKIKNEAAEIAIRTLRRELDAAYKDIERRRTIMQAQDERIDEQDRVIRMQSRRLRTIEDYFIDTRKVLINKGIELPPIPDGFYAHPEDDGPRQQQQQSEPEPPPPQQQQQFQHQEQDDAPGS